MKVVLVFGKYPTPGDCIQNWNRCYFDLCMLSRHKLLLLFARCQFLAHSVNPPKCCCHVKIIAHLYSLLPQQRSRAWKNKREILYILCAFGRTSYFSLRMAGRLGGSLCPSFTARHWWTWRVGKQLFLSMCPPLDSSQTEDSQIRVYTADSVSRHFHCSLMADFFDPAQRGWWIHSLHVARLPLFKARPHICLILSLSPSLSASASASVSNIWCAKMSELSQNQLFMPSLTG